MEKKPKPDLSDYEEEKRPLEDVLRQLLKAKRVMKQPKDEKEDDSSN